MTRPDWPAYFLGIAGAVSRRADCSRRQVGAVLVSPDQQIIGTGYNGTPVPKMPGCLDGACPRASSDVPPGAPYDSGPGKCIAVHAEDNALRHNATRYPGHSPAGAIMYVTSWPCDGCVTLMTAAGISRAVWPGGEILLG
ncbi:cytidine/deoxycytidylate deaminase family protein [Planomonospora alba]|uniref:Cytidine/deoxycytidylate deaminase family protein n=1 Tax=Planomonospora alba TaxID=161354 RepID=A0ABP6N5K2_9ACTN